MANISKKIHELIIFNHSRYIPFWAKTDSVLAQNASQIGAKQSAFWAKTHGRT